MFRQWFFRRKQWRDRPADHGGGEGKASREGRCAALVAARQLGGDLSCASLGLDTSKERSRTAVTANSVCATLRYQALVAPDWSGRPDGEWKALFIGRPHQVRRYVRNFATAGVNGTTPG